MKKTYQILNQFNYYFFNLIFNIISIISIIFLYNFGFFGEQTENISEILLNFFTFSFFNAISIVFIIIILITAISYIRNIRKNIRNNISIELTTYNIIFIPITILLYVALYYVWAFANSAWFCAFIAVFANMFLFNYLYVMFLYKIIDRKCSYHSS